MFIIIANLKQALHLHIPTEGKFRGLKCFDPEFKNDSVADHVERQKRLRIDFLKYDVI